MYVSYLTSIYLAHDLLFYFFFRFMYICVWNKEWACTHVSVQVCAFVLVLTDPLQVPPFRLYHSFQQEGYGLFHITDTARGDKFLCFKMLFKERSIHLYTCHKNSNSFSVVFLRKHKTDLSELSLQQTWKSFSSLSTLHTPVHLQDHATFRRWDTSFLQQHLSQIHVQVCWLVCSYSCVSAKEKQQ